VAVYSRTTEKTKDFMENEVGARPIQAGYELKELAGLLKKPRAVIWLEAAAAQVNDDPCRTYPGPGSAGHLVKMVHNGIEYGILELIHETYDLFKRGLGLTRPELAPICDRL
jgi:6-phosphogluconate dehydrogenase